MSIRWAVFVSFFLLLNGGLTSFSVAEDERVAGRLIVEDVLARPGTPVTLKARLVQDGLLGMTGLGGETVKFTV